MGGSTHSPRLALARRRRIATPHVGNTVFKLHALGASTLPKTHLDVSTVRAMVLAVLSGRLHVPLDYVTRFKDGQTCGKRLCGDTLSSSSEGRILC